MITNASTMKRFLVLTIAAVILGGAAGTTEAGNPRLSLTTVPKKGSQANLKGKVRNANRRKYRVVVYIFTDGWHNKPKVNNPKTRIRKNKTWECDITTKPGDASAKFIAAYLLPRNYNPPRMRGGVEIPTSIDNFARDFAFRSR